MEEEAERNGGWDGGFETLLVTLILVDTWSVSIVEVILCLAVTTPTGIF